MIKKSEPIDETNVAATLDLLRARNKFGESTPNTIHFTQPGPSQPTRKFEAVQIGQTIFYNAKNELVGAEAADNDRNIVLACIAVPAKSTHLVWVRPGHEELLLKNQEWSQRSRLRAIA